MSAAEFAAACGRFDDLLTDEAIRHGNQAELNDAVAAARWRAHGSSGERSLRLKDNPAVGPLAAVVRAVHGLLTVPVKAPAKPQVERLSSVRDEVDVASMGF